MKQIESKYLSFTGILTLLFVSLIAYTFFQISDPLFLKILVLILASSFMLGRGYSFKFTIVDLLIILLFIFEVISFFTSINPSGSFLYLCNSLFILYFYLTLRLYFVNEFNVKHLIYRCLILILLLLLMALLSFFVFKTNTNNSKFENLYDVRFLYKPFGIILNVWSSYLIAFLGIVALNLFYNRHSKKEILISVIVYFLTVYGIVITFSRGAYIALAVFSVFLIIYTVFCKIRKLYKVLLLSGLFFAPFIAVAPHYQDVLRVCKFTETISQKRSLNRRVEMLNNSKKIVVKRPVLGVGSGNFSLSNNEHQFENDDNPFTGYSGSMILQLITEKGIIGTFLCGAIFFCLLFQQIKKKKKNFKAYIISISIISLIIRELSFSSLPETPGLQMFFCFFLALPQENDNENLTLTKISPKISFKPLILISSVIYGIIFIFLYLDKRDKNLNESFIFAIKNNDLDAAVNCIEKTRFTCPYLINRSAVYREYYKKNNSPFALQKSKRNIVSAMELNPYDILLKHNYAILLAAEGKIDSSLLILNDLTAKFSNNALYQTAKFNILYKTGDRMEAKECLSKAIHIEPNILKNKIWKILLQTDSVFTQDVINSCLIQKKHLNDTNPIQMAKDASFFLSLGDTVKAKEYLCRSTKRMPNLSMPWLYLGIIALNENDTIKACDYLSKSFFLDPTNPTIREFYQKRQMTDKRDKEFSPKDENSLFYEKYLLKFQRWYGCKMPSNAIFKND